MKRRSLNKRLLLAAASILAIFLFLTGLALERAFVKSVSRAQEEKLHSNILLLLAAAEPDALGLRLPQSFQEARFNRIASGLYGFIFTLHGAELWRSPSAVVLEQIPGSAEFNKLAVGTRQYGKVKSEEAEQFFYAALGVAWEDDKAVPAVYSFVVMESAAPYQAELQAFRTTLWTWLALAGVLLLVALVLVLRWGLRPLRTLARDVNRIERGQASTLKGDYPEELAGLTHNLNQLLAHERLQRERYKNKLSDLAHSLKTPLAVARGALTPGATDATTIEEQLQRMDDIVQYQLQRATVLMPQLGREGVPLKPLLEKLLDAMAKVYADKSVQVDSELDGGALFYGDERDAFEVLGNIVENAFKYCVSRVRISVSKKSATETSVFIEDDGQGIKDADRALVLQRGQRLDTRSTGQGIGLAVVEDILADYDADMDIRASTLGGALFELNFRQARARRIS